MISAQDDSTAATRSAMSPERFTQYWNGIVNAPSGDSTEQSLPEVYGRLYDLRDRLASAALKGMTDGDMHISGRAVLDAVPGYGKRSEPVRGWESQFGNGWAHVAVRRTLHLGEEVVAVAVGASWKPSAHEARLLAKHRLGEPAGLLGKRFRRWRVGRMMRDYLSGVTVSIGMLPEAVVDTSGEKLFENDFIDLALGKEGNLRISTPRQDVPELSGHVNIRPFERTLAELKDGTQAFVTKPPVIGYQYYTPIVTNASGTVLTGEGPAALVESVSKQYKDATVRAANVLQYALGALHGDKRAALEN